MGDNFFVKFREAVSEKKNQVFGRIREATGRLTERQSLLLISILFAAFVVVDVIYIVRGLRGQGQQIEMQHIRQVEVKQSNTNDNDTETGEDTAAGDGSDAVAGEGR